MEPINLYIAPGNRFITVEKGVTVMEAMTSAGLLLRSDCGGHGRCAKCLFRVTKMQEGALNEPDNEERRLLGEANLAIGQRLACRAIIHGQVRIEVPDDSCLSPEVVQKDLPHFIPKITSHDGSPTEDNLRNPAFGLAIDIGTTTIAVYLCDLQKGILSAATSVRNPQAIFGDDVISRISAVQLEKSILLRLQKLVVKAIDWAASTLCDQTQLNMRTIESVVVVGNSTMIHLLLGQDPSSIGVFPYKPAFVEARTLSATDIGLQFNPAARLCTLPLVSGHIGADLIGAALALNLPQRPSGTLLVDVGTNGEIMLKSDSGLWTTSCATGPAFEGAAVQCGMQATSGAIDTVRFNRLSGCLDYTLIQHDPDHLKRPAGICGSGVISIAAELLQHGVILKNGRLNPDCGWAGLRTEGRKTPVFEIVPAGESQTGRAIVFSQTDVRAVQLAKGALRTGLDLLCLESGIKRPSKILLAGAFGSFIKKADAIKIGMFAEIDTDQIEAVGNAAGAGAIASLFHEGNLAEASRIAQTIRVVDLSSHLQFQEIFIRSLSF
jgi:uncharacterized 2Fe-2S/4Fe-4S cluster protein (DUF4445 family)